MLTWTLTIQHTNTEIQGRKSTFFQDHQNSDHLKQWHTDTQGKKPTFFQDHLNSNRHEDSETQKFNSAHVQQTRQEYSRLTETEKAKFQNPFIYNDDRNFVRHNSVNKIHQTLSS